MSYYPLMQFRNKNLKAHWYKFFIVVTKQLPIGTWWDTKSQKKKSNVWENLEIWRMVF